MPTPRAHVLELRRVGAWSNCRVTSGWRALQQEHQRAIGRLHHAHTARRLAENRGELAMDVGRYRSGTVHRRNEAITRVRVRRKRMIRGCPGARGSFGIGFGCASRGVGAAWSGRPRRARLIVRRREIPLTDRAPGFASGIRAPAAAVTAVRGRAKLQVPISAIDRHRVRLEAEMTPSTCT